MQRPLKIALRFAALVAALTVIPVLFAPSPPASSPYLSALSDLAVSSALAAKPHIPGCNESWCGLTGTTCTVARQMNCKVKRGVCTQTDC